VVRDDRENRDRANPVERRPLAEDEGALDGRDTSWRPMGILNAADPCQ
jgi:hypothetical protein